MTLKGLLVIIILIAVFCGVGQAWDIVKSIAIGLFQYIKMIPQLLKAFEPLIGLNDWITANVVYVAIVCIASWGGLALSLRARKTLWSAVSGIVGLVSTIALLTGLS